MKKNLRFIIFTLLLIGVLVGCSNKKDANEVTIGYFPNLTHIATIVGLEN